MDGEAKPSGPLTFAGSGAAGSLWKATLFLLVVAAALIVLYAGSILAEATFPIPLVFAGFAWLALAMALLVWSLAVLAAAFGWGRLSRAVLVLSIAVFAAAALVSAMSLPVTGERAIVSVVLAACLAGAIACVRAWARTPPAVRAPAAADSGSPPSP